MLASRSKFTKVNSNASQCNKWVPSQNFGGRRHTNKTNMHFVSEIKREVLVLQPSLSGLIA